MKIEGFGMDGKEGINSKRTKVKLFNDKTRSGMDAEQKYDNEGFRFNKRWFDKKLP